MGPKNQVESIINPAYIQYMSYEQRLQDLEKAVLKKRTRTKATEAQRFLMLYHNGQLDAIRFDKELSQNKKAFLISAILDIDASNAEKYLAEISKDIQPLLQTRSNYEYLLNVYEQSKYHSKCKEVEKILLKINLNAEK